ncbi:MFS transporter [Cerasicoccus fimbriatus]|uniref:MFS transporter n=1 Tax=Cerasicoccus fimbriatus TaxID=3014554 RepID=UPI0022B569F5|nr:MFS transporter [Cerasicoccus sp. TK19100]
MSEKPADENQSNPPEEPTPKYEHAAADAPTPEPAVAAPDQDDLEKGMRNLVIDAICARVMTVLTGGAFLVGMGLALGASNLVIGILAAIMPLSQVVQIPAILLVNWTPSRKKLVIAAATLGRMFLLGIAAIPFFAPEGWAVPAFLFCLAMFFMLSAVAGCSMNSWMRDLIPQDQFGSFFGKRLAIATLVGAVLMVFAGVAVDQLQKATGSSGYAYASVFVIGGVFGIAGALSLKGVPEPAAERRKGLSFLKIMIEPLKDKRFRRLLWFSATWNFAIIMAGAFAAVYMLERVKISIGVVVALAVLNQLINAWFFRLWGILADRTSNKAILQVACPIFISTIVMYPFTTMPDYWAGSIPILIVIHVLGGIATAGFLLCTANIALEFAPKGQATAYLATNATLAGLAATCSPILGGWMADYFNEREFRITATYRAPEGEVDIPAMIMGGLDFVFILAACVGLLALHFLSKIEEEGTIEEKEILNQAYASARSSIFGLSNMVGMRRFAYFPLEMLDTVAVQPTRRVAGAVHKGFSDATGVFRGQRNNGDSNQQNDPHQ